MEKQYSTFRLREGNIADYSGDALVVPAWSNLHTGTSISHALNQKLEKYNIRPETFWPTPRGKAERIPLFSAIFYDSHGLPGINGLILAAYYVDNGEQDAPVYVKAAKTAADVLKIAHEHDVRSIAIPAFLGGDQGGGLEVVVPAMLDEFGRHRQKGGIPSDITLYLYGRDSYNMARQIADMKLR